jgi:hypothetical protein
MSTDERCSQGTPYEFGFATEQIIKEESKRQNHLPVSSTEF